MRSHVFGEEVEAEIKFLSGSIFDLYLFNIFGIRLGFERTHMRSFAKTNVKVMVISLESLDVMANKSAPPISIAWRNFLLSQVSSEYVSRVVHPGLYFE